MSFKLSPDFILAKYDEKKRTVNIRKSQPFIKYIIYSVLKYRYNIKVNVSSSNVCVVYPRTINY